MDISPRERGIYRFGPFALDPTRRVMLRDGVRVKLAGRLFDMLLYLVVNHGRLVERDELLQAVWGGRVVEENNIAQAISTLRKALQTEDPDDRFIVTAPGRGYRFAANLAFEPDAVLPAGDRRDGQDDHPVPARTSWKSLAPLALCVCVCVCVAVLAAVGPTRWRGYAPNAESSRVERAVFAPAARSVAVLAFENMTGDPAQVYFSDGLSEELIDALGRVSAIQVAARTSAFSFKGSRATVGDIARKLDVGTVLEGSVRRNGNRLRIAAALVDARSGLQLWSRTYDRDRVKDDPLDVQRDIATAVAGALEVRLAGDDAARLTAGGTHNPLALDAYLHGAMTADILDDAHSHAAIADFERAIALDPTFALAYVGRAAALTFISANGEGDNVDNGKAILTAALGDADHAMALAPALPQAHLAKAQILQYQLDFIGQMAELTRAVDLSPGGFDAESRYGTAEAFFGHFDKALPAVRHAIALDPLVPKTYRNLGKVLYWQRHFDEALEAYRRADTLDSHPSFTKQDMIALVYLAKGTPEPARRICERGEGWSRGECLAIAYHALGRQPDAQVELAKLQKGFGDSLAYNYADIFAQWGQPDLAVHWLREALRLNDTGLCSLISDPLLDGLRKRADFREIQARLKFPS